MARQIILVYIYIGIIMYNKQFLEIGEIEGMDE